MKICYCGYDFFSSSLEALIESGHELVELFSWPTDNEYNFNDRVFAIASKEKARISLSPMDSSDLTRLQQQGVDAIVAAAYPYRIPPWLNYVKYALNVHPSKLPDGKGPWPLPWTILKSLSETALTVHKISSQWDSGDVLLQKPITLSERDTLESLSLKAQLASAEALPFVMANIEELWRHAKPQVGGSYWKLPGKEDRTLKFDKSIDDIDRLVRAFSKFETFVYLDGVRHFVRKVDVWRAEHTLAPGTKVLSSSRETVYAALDGLVALSMVVRADEK